MSTDEVVLDAVLVGDDLADIVFTGLDRGTHHGVEIGRGSQGQVSRIKVEDQGLDVAVKSILMSQMETLSQLDRLEREAAVLQSLPNHPGVARYLGYRTREIPRTGSIDTEYSILMEYVDGDPLSLAVGKPIDDITLLDYCDQLYNTLGFLHSHNVVHRDIKPSNVMRLKDGTVKVIDFGLVKKTDWTTMTASKGAFLGSLNYAAPEIEDGKSATVAADLYSLAVMLTVLKRGKEFSHRDRLGDIRAAVKEMHFDKPELKERLEAMLSEDPEKRMEKFRLVDGEYVYTTNGGEVVSNSMRSNVMKKSQSIDLPGYIGLGGLLGMVLGLVGASLWDYGLYETTGMSQVGQYITFTGAALGAWTGGFVGYLKRNSRKKNISTTSNSKENIPPPHQTTQDIYARIGKVSKKEKPSLSLEKFLKSKSCDEAKRFKRKALGFFGWKKSKSPNEMVSILYDLGMVSSMEEGKRVLPSLRNHLYYYTPSIAVGIQYYAPLGKEEYVIYKTNTRTNDYN